MREIGLCLQQARRNVWLVVFGCDKMKDIYILGIESSCDEMSASIVKNGMEEIKTIVLSQIPPE